MCSLLPIHFDREFTAICQCSIYGSLIDYRFRVKNYRAGADSHKDGDTFMENGILVELKYIDLINDDFAESTKPKVRAPKWTPNNMAEYFFFDEFGFLSINEKRIQECYQEFTQSMSLIYHNVKTIYNKYA